jgi:O-6-methylguanine DNA methyltransferase
VSGPHRAPHTSFAHRVLHIVSRIPCGRVATYGDVARLAGRAGAARAVGNIMRAADRPGLPYHRVIAAGGRVGGYGGTPGIKAGLLRAEGLTVRRDRVVQFAQVRWAGRRPPAPGARAQALERTRTTRGSETSVDGR